MGGWRRIRLCRIGRLCRSDRAGRRVGGLESRQSREHHWMLAMFDKRAQDIVWNKDPNALIASSFIFPAGRARKVDGGYVLRGSWPFSSGVDSSEWNMLASVVSSDDEADGIEYRIFLVNRSDYTIKDTWNATGLRGTGSNDVEVQDAFVADAMTLAVSDLD